ncbi:MAG TPA: ATP-binding protein [Chitinophagaceae bacterium]|nr:ATP-binding protein [Chitinophagaceae bacterium]
MKRRIVILVLSCYTVSGFAQFSNIDSLRNLISKEKKEDTIRVNRLLQICGYDTYNKPDSGIYYANNALRISQKLGYTYGVATAYAWLQQGYWVLGDYSRSMQYALEAMSLYRQMKRTDNVSEMGSAIGDIYRGMGDYKKALYYYLDARKMYEARRDAEQLSYSDVCIADAYLEGNMLDSALFFAKRGFAKDRELKQDWTYPALVLGNVYAKRNQFDLALFYYRSTFKMTARNDQVDINNGIATIYRTQSQTDSCRYYAVMALDTAQTIQYRKGAMRASELLSWAYEKTNPVEAIRYYKISMAIKDSLYNQEKISRVNGLIFDAQLREQELQAAQVKYRNRLKMYGLLVVVGSFLSIALFLWRGNRRRKKAYALLQEQKQEIDNQKERLQQTLKELRSTQALLIQQGKMASLGELTAGISHEIQNPLNFVNNFSEVNKDLLAEMKDEISKGNYEEVKSIASSIEENEQKINLHGKRADAIVKGMLQHSRTSKGQKEPTDINALADEYLRLSYHGIRAKDKSFNTNLKTDFDTSIGKINIIPQDIGRVLLNLYNNAFYAVNEWKRASTLRQTQSEPSLAGQSNDYEPTVSVSTKKLNDKVEIRVRDNGNGVAQKIVDKIFQPFFTTKPAGQGTGLGLSLAYDIIKAHGGEIKVETKEGEGTTFVIQLAV